ncbi:hypothetical protein [Actinomadura macra]|uniref:hypothetical protein n=1 Tax=Actinomadura macra TaxID=46164 RepID=UPI00350E3A45
MPLADQSGAPIKPGKAGTGNRWLRGALGTAAMTCARTKDAFLGEPAAHTTVVNSDQISPVQARPHKSPDRPGGIPHVHTRPRVICPVAAGALAHTPVPEGVPARTARQCDRRIRAGVPSGLAELLEGNPASRSFRECHCPPRRKPYTWVSTLTPFPKA